MERAGCLKPKGSVCRGMKASSIFWEQQLILRCSAVDRNDPEETKKKQINDEEEDSVETKRKWQLERSEEARVCLKNQKQINRLEHL